MSAPPRHAIITRRNLIAFAAIETILFLLANLTAKNSSHPGPISNAFWVAFLIGAARLILLALTAVVRKRQAAR